jgi:hypothetical protein
MSQSLSVSDTVRMKSLDVRTSSKYTCVRRGGGQRIDTKGEGAKNNLVRVGRVKYFYGMSHGEGCEGG